MAFTDYHKILLFGDSITEQSYDQTRGFGFGAEITNVYRRKLEVVCRGFSGYNTAHALHVLPKFMPKPNENSSIKLMTIFFGANDAVLPDRPQYIPLDKYCQNLKAIVQHASIKPHNPKFIIIAPAPICEYLTQDGAAEKGTHHVQSTATRTKEYADAAVAVGKELGIPTVNLWKAFIDYAGGYVEGQPLPGSRHLPRNKKLAILLRDGLHFNPEGYKIMYDEVLNTIITNYPEFDPKKMRFVFPHWMVAEKAH